MREESACDLERLIKQTYKVKEGQCDIVCGIMLDQKIITGSAHPANPKDDKMTEEALEKFKAGELKLSDNYPDNAQCLGPGVLEYVLNDLCFKKKIKKGEFLICFDD